MLTDFGLAKGRAYTVLTKPGQVMGTLDYLAPELVKGEPASPATDIYALGCTIYECVAGQPPFADKEGIQVGLAHVAEPPPALVASSATTSRRAFEAAVLSALAKDPQHGRRRQSSTATGWRRPPSSAAERRSAVGCRACPSRVPVGCAVSVRSAVGRDREVRTVVGSFS